MSHGGVIIIVDEDVNPLRSISKGAGHQLESVAQEDLEAKIEREPLALAPNSEGSLKKVGAEVACFLQLIHLAFGVKQGDFLVGCNDFIELFLSWLR